MNNDEMKIDDVLNIIRHYARDGIQNKGLEKLTDTGAGIIGELALIGLKKNGIGDPSRQYPVEEICTALANNALDYMRDVNNQAPSGIRYHLVFVEKKCPSTYNDLLDDITKLNPGGNQK